MPVSHQIASNGRVIPFDSLPQTFSYNTDGSINYIQVIYDGATYRQSFTYSSGVLTGISAWVATP